MTQKSDGRRRRDQANASMERQGVRSPYADLEEVYQEQRKMFQPYAEMAAMIADPRIANFVADKVHTQNLMRTLATEVKDLSTKTEILHNKHAGKNKMPNLIDADENFEIIMMMQEYQMLFGMHSQLIVPILFELDEIVSKAATAHDNALRAALEKEAAEKAAAEPATTAAEAAPAQ